MRNIPLVGYSGRRNCGRFCRNPRFIKGSPERLATARSNLFVVSTFAVCSAVFFLIPFKDEVTCDMSRVSDFDS